jgi:hypothetical protein
MQMVADNPLVQRSRLCLLKIFAAFVVKDQEEREAACFLGVTISAVLAEKPSE